jgi:serine/threonine-protein kinase
MGVVYRAFDPTLGRPIALKTILVDHLVSETRSGFERRFLAEARIAARLSHPGIVVVHDFGRDAASGLLFIALECLAGETLAHKLDQGRLPAWRDALRIVGRVAAALHHAHEHGVVHRDVKPANIMIRPSGEPKIMDFGIAHAEQGPGGGTELGGTPLYMSPEQALGEAVDGRTDLFSLGAIAYALLTGRPPFRGDSVRGILARVAYRQPPWPSELVPTLPKDVDRIVARAMVKAPAERYRNGLELAEDVDDVLAGQPPRHCKGFTPPERGSGTILSKGSGAPGDLEDLPLEELEESLPWPPRTAPPRQRVPRSRRAALLGALALALAAYLYSDPEPIEYWRGTLAPIARSVWALRTTGPSTELPEIAPPTPIPPAAMEETPASLPPGEGPSQDEAVVVTPSDVRDTTREPSASTGPNQTTESSPSLQTAATPPADPEVVVAPASLPGGPVVQPGAAPPSPVAEPAPAPPPQPSSTPTPPSVAPARLGVEFEHGLKSGTLRLWVDGAPKLTQKLSSKVQRKALVFETRRGRVEKQLVLPPGSHEIRAQVDWGGNTSTGRLRARFAQGQTRLLGIELKDGALRMAWR